ncbi:MAG: M20/M25/M40 family metallo-hydrolase [Gemmatimonadetes bacterium]|nr:M20/M25/M40 family metallo-hydrolase [Gemmatimonadota bacterium]
MRVEPGFAAAIAFARDLIRIPSPPGGEGELAERVRREMEALSYDEVWVDGAGNVIGVLRGQGSAPPVMLSCHLDAVAAGEPGEWEHPPFAAEVSHGHLHGRGAMDIKGPLAIQTHAAALLAGRAPGDVIVAHTVLEERGGWGMAHLLESGDVEAAAVIIGEATAGDIAIGHRGRAELEIRIHGVAAHASAPERAHNPLDLVPAVLESVRELGGTLESDPVLGAATLVATGVEVSPESRNVIPDLAVVVLDWRTLPGISRQEHVRRVRAALDQRLASPPEGLRVEVRFARERLRSYTGLGEERTLYTPGFLMDADHPVVRAAVAAVAGPRPPAVRPWTFATDGGYTCGVHGIPTVGFAPGEERFAHTNRERLELRSAEDAFRVYPELIIAVQNAAG